MNPGAIGAISAALGVPIVFVIFQKLFPFKPPLAQRKYSFEELKKKYRKWEVFALLPFFTFTAALGYAWYKGFLFFAHLSAQSMEESVYLIVPDALFWALPAIFLGIVSTALPMDLLYKILLRARYGEYTLYTNLRAGFDGWKVFRGFAILVSIGSIIVIILGMNCYARFTKDEIIINPFWSFNETRYPYSKVRAVKVVSNFETTNGNIVGKPRLVVEFDDGARWTTKDALRDPKPIFDSKLAKFVAERSEKSIQRIRLKDDLDDERTK